MSGGLLGGFDNVMAGLSAEDVERASAAATSTRPASQLDGQPDGPDSAPEQADQRGADPRSLALARRILGLDVEDRAATQSLRFTPIIGGAELELDRSFTGALIIGRAEGGVAEPDRQLVIDRAVVSRRHCQVVVTPGGFAVTDLGATNATAVLRGGVLHAVGDAPLLLQPGDIISTVNGECPMIHVETVYVDMYTDRRDDD